jgi:hypothetical protein
MDGDRERALKTNIAQHYIPDSGHCMKMISSGKASRSLGEESKKRGLSTTLPLALGRLQARGDIRRRGRSRGLRS